MRQWIARPIGYSIPRWLLAAALFGFVIVGMPSSSASQGTDSPTMDQNYPNPFTGSTTINYTIPNPGGHVSINLYNLLGEQVQNLVELDLGAGPKTLRFDAGSLPSGQYTYRMIFTGSTVTKISRRLYIIK